MVDKIVKLENDAKYVLLDETTIDNVKYYLGLRLDEKNEPTDKYLYFEEKKEEKQMFLKPIKDDKVKDLLLTSFTINYLDKVYDEAL